MIQDIRARSINKRDIVAKLLLNSQAVQDMLQQQGNPLMAEGLEKLDLVLHDLETKVNNTDPNDEQGQLTLKGLEDLVIIAEGDLNAEISDSTGEISDTHVNDTETEQAKKRLRDKVAELLLSSKTAQDLLSKLDKKHLAKGLKMLDSLLNGTYTEVSKADPQSDAGKSMLQGLEIMIEHTEIDLNAEIKLIEGEIRDGNNSYDIPVIIDQAELMIDRANKLSDELDSKGRAVEAKSMAVLVSGVKTLLKKVQDYNPYTGVGRLVQKAIESSPIERPESESTLSKEELILKLAELLLNSKTVQDFLKKEGKPLLAKVQDFLKKEGKPLLAKGLEKLDVVLHELDEKVHKADPKTKIGQLALQELEKLIAKTEKELEAEIKKIEDEIHKKPPTSFAGLSKEELLLKLAEMLLNSKTVQDFLKKEGKPLLAKGLEKLDTLLHDLDDKVHIADPKTKIGKLALEGLEKLISKAEVDLEAEIKKIEDEIHKKPPTLKLTMGLSKEELLLKLAEMLLNSKTVQDFLKKEGKPLLAKGLEKLDVLLHELDDKVHKADPKTKIGKLALEGLEKLIEKTEVELEAEIKKIEDEIHKKPPTMRAGLDIDGIIKTAEMLISKAKVLVEELKQQGRDVEAKGLALLEDAAIDAVQKVKEYKPITELDKLVQLGLVSSLKFAEKELDDFIQKLAPPTSLATANDMADVIKTGEMLVDKAKLLVEELKQKGRDLEAKGLALLEDLAIDALQKVKEYKPLTAIGRLIQNDLVNKLKWAETKLDNFIQNLTQ
ncbi:unnamed protein product [Medioppia subpectinata]|uniref:Uncharacterized protein n=1 Tax=Medioppia subpectinata TaxID=1979941 RepID=A0A7R9KJV2_9ACAR|nr:unnamed protein product [Medioppia subpectinata]CAG2104878.1 unnamed protein product [Medioppia subpectinata]